mmetsp:Transcript_16616/g.21562  ORF Transcript_16616/g.21562 Transcript_16616/m.21562 type:complete len:413 (+) Transcript_16616:15-1253(+)|eukprot:CAMPEP_0114360486 /NCGR_PEP_ID=MMETSP0101-20121206/23906_1 /TAXON_ID=38822 ORGANISM="Pteridomonas danica, Strain PT" /NCGR_SAMPLE_ID=MMETSP0101 /ASSEMBLY_ACC=CAM_ASM_000211 /LENGTH=412 /DNA_ID=CAMNT_0001504759 /DNA_START=17 /DNA_END=1255 /DNA_ORIENTATION=+
MAEFDQQEDEAIQQAIDQVEEVVEMAINQGPKQPKLREMAAEFFLGVSATEKGRKALHNHGATKVLVKWIGDSLETVSINSYSTLVNLSADMLEDRIGILLELKITNRIFETLTDDEASPQLTDSALMLMANITTIQEGSREALMSDDPVLIGQRMRRIVEKFLTIKNNENENEIDAWQHVATILCNVSQIQDGRDLLRRRSTKILPRLALELNSKNVIRRRGAAASIRNCCYETMDHDWLLYDIEIVGHLLLPLSGPEPLLESERDGLLPMILNELEKQGNNKKREDDIETRKSLLNAIHLLCTSKISRQFLRKVRAYPIIRNMDNVENESDNKEIIFNIVNFLIRDEEDGDNEDILGKGEMSTPIDMSADEDLPPSSLSSNYNNESSKSTFLGHKDVVEIDEASEMHSVD